MDTYNRQNDRDYYSMSYARADGSYGYINESMYTSGTAYGWSDTYYRADGSSTTTGAETQYSSIDDYFSSQSVGDSAPYLPTQRGTKPAAKTSSLTANSLADIDMQLFANPFAMDELRFAHAA